jgi:ELWxxDGT repeat protein
MRLPAKAVKLPTANSAALGMVILKRIPYGDVLSQNKQMMASMRHPQGTIVKIPRLEVVRRALLVGWEKIMVTRNRFQPARSFLVVLLTLMTPLYLGANFIGSAMAGSGKAIFDDAYQNNLWVTDGTSAGTMAVTAQGANSTGLLFPLGEGPDFTVFDGKALFAGVDTLNRENLWITDGTAEGTQELLIPGESSDGLLSFSWSGTPGFTVLGGEVLFEGFDAASGRANLWVTNGTTAGTKILNVTGSSDEGLFDIGFPALFFVFGHKAFFEAQDAEGVVGLWVTDGTAAGTHELKVSGAYSGGLFTIPAFGQPEFTVIRGKLLFQGIAADGSQKLWVSKGTGATTRKIRIKGTPLCGPFCASPPYLTAVGSKVVFFALDKQFRTHLFVTDGTTVDTRRLAVEGAYGGGILGKAGQEISPDITPFGNRAVFVGEDSIGNVGLWITDGTAAGTKELIPTNAYVGGLFYNSAQWFGPDFTVLGNQVIFAGVNANGIVGLWVSDGTANGTHEISTSGAYSGGLLFFSPESIGPQFRVFGNSALFGGLDSQGYESLWTTDGTTATELSAEVAPFDITVLTN